jgi:hypothetical protein
MFDQPQHLVVFRRVQRLDNTGMDCIKELGAVAADPALPDFGQNVGHALSSVAIAVVEGIVGHDDAADNVESSKANFVRAEGCPASA